VKNRTAILAAAAGALFLATSPALAAGDQGKDVKIKCEGVNSCKGHGDCKTAQNDCKGHNGCKGKGFKMMSAEECAAAQKKMGMGGQM
jgi:uncharacterized membrane protein